VATIIEDRNTIGAEVALSRLKHWLSDRRVSEETAVREATASVKNQRRQG
jgi:hypothetical protein